MCKTFLHGYTVKKKDLFDNNSIISATAKSYISISYQKDLFSKDTRIFTASLFLKLLLQPAAQKLQLFLGVEPVLSLCQDRQITVKLLRKMCYRRKLYEGVVLSI